MLHITDAAIINMDKKIKEFSRKEKNSNVHFMIAVIPSRQLVSGKEINIDLDQLIEDFQSGKIKDGKKKQSLQKDLGLYFILRNESDPMNQKIIVDFICLMGVDLNSKIEENDIYFDIKFNIDKINGRRKANKLSYFNVMLNKIAFAKLSMGCVIDYNKSVQDFELRETNKLIEN